MHAKILLAQNHFKTGLGGNLYSIEYVKGSIIVLYSRRLNRKTSILGPAS